VSQLLYAGLMSGTSLDGVDAVLLDLAGQKPVPVAHAHHPFDPGLRDALLGLNASGEDELARAAECGNELARRYAAAIAELRTNAAVAARDVRAIGCHGQTVRHRPDAGYTLQLGNAALLAELTGICVVADFRSRDVAAGGQGAPLAPAFHAAMFSSAAEYRAVLNLGGMANLTGLPTEGAATGFDTGPGNCLMDLWAMSHLGQSRDEGGAWAASARADPALLERFLEDPYFSRPPPKSTGRDLFNQAWLSQRLISPADPGTVQATLLELTAQSIARALQRDCAGTQRLIVCGGGVHNGTLMARLGHLVSPMPVESSALHGIDPMQVEAAAFAWLAHRTVQGLPGNLPTITGARAARVLGAIHPA
jgi:anhydro-N-acetylmuramic acid kinase